jgi:hypothetical protein
MQVLHGDRTGPGHTAVTTTTRLELVHRAVHLAREAVAVYEDTAGGERAARPDWLRAGSALLAAGALLDAAGVLAPVVARQVAEPVAWALLALAVALDAAFNLLLGLGLVVVGLALGRESGWPIWLRGLAVVGGLVSLPVAGQIESDTWARLLAVSGPLWLLWLAGAGLRLGRGAIAGARTPTEAAAR